MENKTLIITGHLPDDQQKWHTHDRIFPENTKDFRKIFSRNTFGELVLVFQFFKQFDWETIYFIFKFQKVFSHRIFKNRYSFLFFLRVRRNALR